MWEAIDDGPLVISSYPGSKPHVRSFDIYKTSSISPSAKDGWPGYSFPGRGFSWHRRDHANLQSWAHISSSKVGARSIVVLWVRALQKEKGFVPWMRHISFQGDLTHYAWSTNAPRQPYVFRLSEVGLKKDLLDRLRLWRFISHRQGIEQQSNKDCTVQWRGCDPVSTESSRKLCLQSAVTVPATVGTDDPRNIYLPLLLIYDYYCNSRLEN
jgi:hypothetical protein